MREYRGLTAKRSQNIAQGFSPGISPPQKCALKGRPIGTKRNKSTDADTKNGRDWREVEASSLEPNAASPSGATREAVLGLPSPNCTPPRGVEDAFRAHLCDTSNPGLKPWAKICYRFAVNEE
jgi:hypothetical protein